MSDENLDDFIKKARANKLLKQTQLIQKRLDGVVTKQEHEAAMEEQRKSVLNDVGEALLEFPAFLVAKKIITAGKEEAVEDAIAEWLEVLAEQ